MKNRRFKFEYRKNASALHKKVGECLREWLPNNQIYQEYPVNKINEYFPSGKEKFDWVIMEWQVVIECHGKQHYEPVDFSGKLSQKAAQVLFEQRQESDKVKKKAAIEAGWTYIAIPYTDEKIIDSEYIDKLIEKDWTDEPTKEYRMDSKRPKWARSLSYTRPQIKYDWKSGYQKRKEFLEESGIAEAQRERARAFRKDQRRRNKERHESYRLKKQAQEASDETI